MEGGMWTGIQFERSVLVIPGQREVGEEARSAGKGHSGSLSGLEGGCRTGHAGLCAHRGPVVLLTNQVSESHRCEIESQLCHCLAVCQGKSFYPPEQQLPQLRKGEEDVLRRLCDNER